MHQFLLICKETQTLFGCTSDWSAARVSHGFQRVCLPDSCVLRTASNTGACALRGPLMALLWSSSWQLLNFSLRWIVEVLGFMHLWPGGKTGAWGLQAATALSLSSLETRASCLVYFQKYGYF